ncbi:hypothetical protein NSK_003476 [Nannochloropsis salina CCMP1776]|uniref:Uncharacterized protein n=1 Tax=Nannochloropsis salina CCMP1776 TaxID=1027361 RepID=A0A4D9D095_9STRA|nr:hypothetical protein NSK_003476 [Nannochloropsis salina CCMP1776]|eukprot:TFJ85052.1 hypothetical protein NSK_003476 [Nannochloropsis salina CCMP1776]
MVGLLCFTSISSLGQSQKLLRSTDADSREDQDTNSMRDSTNTKEQVIVDLDGAFSPTRDADRTEGRAKTPKIRSTVGSPDRPPVAALQFPTVDQDDKRAAIEWDVDTNEVSRGYSWPHCYWHAKYAINYTHFGLIDPNAVYWGQLVRGSGANVAYKMKGRFPKSIYFSWQVYASQTSAAPDQKVTDFHVKPLWGTNPFSNPDATPEDMGGYEVYLTPSGEEGYVNELRLPNATINQLILRMYKPDPILGPSISIIDLEPPTLYMAHDMGEGKREWKALPRCSAAKEKLLADLSNAWYEIQYPHATGTEGRGVIPILREMNCPMNPTKGNVSFVLFQGDWLPPELAIARQSQDSPYMMYCINPYNDWRHYLNTLLKIRFKLPVIADGLFSGIRVANVGDYEVRYLSMSTADGFYPTIASIDGRGMQRFYNYSSAGNSSWDGWVEIRVALNEAKARACNFWSDQAIFLPLEVEDVHPAKSIVLFLRSILAHGPKSAGAASKACGNSVLCGNPPFIRSIMQEQYPELEVYHCDSCEGKPPLVTRYEDYFKNH